MIEIYIKTNTNYDKNGDITLEPTSCTYKDSEKLLTLEHPFDEENRWKYISNENVISAEENGKKRFYRIYNVVRSLYSVTAYARPLFYDLLDKVLLDVRPTLKNGQEALDIILAGTGFTGHSNIATISTSYFIRKNIVDALLGDYENSFLNRWGGEFYCENYDIYINDRIGSDNGVRVEFRHNLNEIEEDVNIEEVATRIIPTGFDGIMLEGNTPWVDSPLLNKYTHPKMRVINFDDVKVKENTDDEEGFNTIAEARAELIKRCNELFEGGIDKPTVNYKIDMINLANTTAYKDFKMLVNVSKGDTVTCYIQHLDIDVKARVIDFEKDKITGEYISIELGNVTSNFFNDQADIQSKIDKILNKDGTVNAIEVAGVLNAINVKMRAMKDVAQKQDVRALLCEDLDPNSPTYGAMCYGTMGFMIASERTLDNKDWNWRTFGTGKGFFADLIVAGTMLADRIKGGILESIDGALQIDLRETSKGIQFKKNGQKAIDINGQNIYFYDWEGTERTTSVGQIYSARRNNQASQVGIALANMANAYLAIGYQNKNNLSIYPSYITFDKDGITGNAQPITFHEAVKFWQNINLEGTKILGGKLCDIGDNNGFYAENDGSYISGNAYALNDFSVFGKKNCIQLTKTYGNRLFYSVEDTESYLTDTCSELITVSKTDEETFERIILIDTIFKECVSLEENYIVDIHKFGWGDFRIKEQTTDYFILESDREDFTFKYTIKAKRKGYEDIRLEKFERSF